MTSFGAAFPQNSGFASVTDAMALTGTASATLGGDTVPITHLGWDDDGIVFSDDFGIQLPSTGVVGPDFSYSFSGTSTFSLNDGAFSGLGLTFNDLNLGTMTTSSVIPLGFVVDGISVTVQAASTAVPEPSAVFGFVALLTTCLFRRGRRVKPAP